MIARASIAIGNLNRAILSRQGVWKVLPAVVTPGKFRTCSTNSVVSAGTPATVATKASAIMFSRAELHKLALEGKAKVAEDKRVKEEEELLKKTLMDNAMLREVEKCVLKELDKCVLECTAQAIHHGAMGLACRLQPPTMSYDKESNARQVVKLREVLERELPLRLPGVDFKLTEQWDTTHKDAHYVRGFRIDLDWEAK